MIAGTKSNATAARYFAAAIGAALFCAAHVSFGQQDKPEFLGVDSCERCHIRPLPRDEQSGVTKFVLMTESDTWSRLDKHALAFELIDPARSPLSAQICRLLNIDDIHQAQQCLSCHANWLRGDQRPSTYQRGVTCESCHGPASLWERPHANADWRTKSLAEKRSAGEIDVRDPVGRAEQCFSCHIGNAAEGKVVTHEMYAAGHPPLPGIEVETFSAELPPHWRYLSEKPDFQFRDEFIAANCEHLAEQDGREQHRTKAVILGGAVAARQSVQLLIDLASSDGQPWPELSAFHCSACHHDLKAAGDDGPRDFGSAVIGRPPLHLWPTVLLKLAVMHSVDYDQPAFAQRARAFDTALEQLRKAVASRPFGDPAAIRTAGRRLVGGLDRLIAELRTARFELQHSRQALAFLLEHSQRESAVWDYHTARQIAWAAKTIQTELAAPYAATDEAIATWQTDVRAPAVAATEKRFADAGLTADLFLALPATQTESIVDAQPAALRAIAEFDYQEYRRQMAELARELLGP